MTDRRNFVRTLAAITIPTSILPIRSALSNAAFDKILSGLSINISEDSTEYVANLNIPDSVDIIHTYDTSKGEIFLKYSYIDGSKIICLKKNSDRNYFFEKNNAIIDKSGRTFYKVRADDEIIKHKRTEISQITSVHGKLRHLVFLEEDYGFSADARPEHNARALQTAINDASQIYLPRNGRPCPIAGEPIMLKPHTQLLGFGPQLSILNTQSPLVFESGSGRDEVGPVLRNFRINTQGSGVRFNNSAGGFDDSPQSQKSIMRSRFERIHLHGPGSRTNRTVGLELIKCFGAIISQCEIEGYSVGYRSEGSDLCSLTDRTRIWHCDVLVELISVGTFGSGTILNGLDLLNAYETYVRSSDRDLIIKNCYLELSRSTSIDGPVFDITSDYAVSIEGNRIEIPSSRAPYFLRLSGDPTVFSFCHNKQGGDPWGGANVNAGLGLKYYRNNAIRTRVFCEGNSYPISLPMITCSEYHENYTRYSLERVITPATGGLLNKEYGEHVRVIDESFLIPPNGNDNINTIYFSCDNDSITSRGSVHLIAIADNEDAEIVCSLEAFGSVIKSSTIKISKTRSIIKIIDEIDFKDVIISIQPSRKNRGATRVYGIVLRGCLENR